MRDYFLAFVPIFVAMDAIGVLPIFLSLTEGLSPEERRGVVKASIATAFAVGVGFLFLGKFIFSVIGVTVADFKVAGGIILLILAIYDLIFPEKKRRAPKDTVGIVPLGMPLVVGPAVLTTILICVDSYGYLPTILSLVANLLLAWWVFQRAELLIRLLGDGGVKGVAKVASLLLAAIAVMMIRLGIAEILKGWPK